MSLSRRRRQQFVSERCGRSGSSMAARICVVRIINRLIRFASLRSILLSPQTISFSCPRIYLPQATAIQCLASSGLARECFLRLHHFSDQYLCNCCLLLHKPPIKYVRESNLIETRTCCFCHKTSICIFCAQRMQQQGRNMITFVNY